MGADGGNAVMGLAHSPRIVTDGLVLCLDAASKRSYPGTGTTWTDLKGGNNGTLTNGPTFDAGNGGGIVFDGTDDEVSISSSDFSVFSLTATQGVTVSCWVKLDSSTESRYMFHGGGSGSEIVLKYDNSNTPPNTTGALADKFTFLILVPSGGKSTTASSVHSTTSPDGNWINVVGTRDESGVFKMYVNGVLEGTDSANSSAFPTPASVVIGDGNSGEQSISLVYYYNRKLSADEIRQNYEATKGRYI